MPEFTFQDWLKYNRQKDKEAHFRRLFETTSDLEEQVRADCTCELCQPQNQIPPYNMNAELNNVEKRIAVTVNQQTAAQLEAQIIAREVERRMSIARSWGELERFPDGTVIKFEKQFSKAGPTYKYAAVKVDGTWYFSGRQNRQLDDAGLVKFLLAEGDVATETFLIATSWENVEDFDGLEEPVAGPNMYEEPLGPPLPQDDDK
jgi:hypothetical protein